MSTHAILFAFLLTGALISMWISDSAVAAFLMPIAVNIAKEHGLEPLKSNFWKALLIACAWGPSVGGIATPAGAAPNPLVLSFLSEMAGIEKSFLDWMMIGVPAAIVLLPVSWLILVKVYPPEMKELALNNNSPKNKNRPENPLSRHEWFTLIIFIVTVSLWISAPLIYSSFGIALPMEYVIISTTLFLFFPKVDILTWKDVHQGLNWGALLLVMAGVSIGFTVHASGATEWMSYALLSELGKLNVFGMVVGTVLLISLLHNLLSSNTVTCIVMIPVIIYIAAGTGLPVWLATASAGFASTLGLIMVTSTPTNLIPYTAGYFSIKDFARAGIFMTVIGSFTVGCVIYIIHLLIGL